MSFVTKITKALPKLNKNRTAKLNDQVSKTEVGILAHALLLGGLVVVQVLFGEDEPKVK